MFKQTIIVLVLLISTGNVKAGELHLVVNGISNHSENDKNPNENNTGWGFEYDLEQRKNWIPFITGGQFKDSTSHRSKYLGAGSKRRYKIGFTDFHLDAGVFAFLMTRYDHNNNDPFISALPFISIGNKWAAINAMYVPALNDYNIAFMYYQISFRVIKF